MTNGAAGLRSVAVVEGAREVWVFKKTKVMLLFHMISSFISFLLVFVVGTEEIAHGIKS